MEPTEGRETTEIVEAGALERLIACPNCDALYVLRRPDAGEEAVCARCHSVLIAPKRKAGRKILALTTTVLILLVTALFFPFLTISVYGFANQATILDPALAFRSGPMVVLSLVTGGMIIVIPVVQTLLTLYVLLPLVRDREPFAHARTAFGISQRLKPWAMAEIFAIGCAVALVKVADLAKIGFGLAFWLFAVLVVVVLINDNFFCTWSVWRSLEGKRR